MVTLIPIFLWFSNVIFCLYYGICVCFSDLPCNPVDFLDTVADTANPGNIVQCSNCGIKIHVKISNDPEKLRLAAENFLNKNTEYIASVAREVLEGNVREIVGKMRLEEMVSDRQKFANLVKENAEPDLAAMGWIRLPEMCRWSWQKSLRA